MYSELLSGEVGICAGLQGDLYEVQQQPRSLEVYVMVEVTGRTDNFGLIGE